jgi:SAM-dependent methyltransferase
MELTQKSLKNIEINSCGPFVHSYYEIDGEIFTQAGPLDGRAKSLIQTSLEILERITVTEKKDLRILDVGCYDGWILNRLWHSGYKNLVGLEPRLGNIERGLVVRTALGLEDGARHYHGTLGDKSDFQSEEPFDVVLCFGVIHHINDILGFISQLRGVLKPGGTLILETLTLNDRFSSPELSEALEPKDIVYRGDEAKTSLIGVKLESNYYPGSTTNSGTVQIPARQALLWFLEQSKFNVESANNGWEENQFDKSLKVSHRRNLKSTVIEATAISNKSGELNINRKFVQAEQVLTWGVLDEGLLSELSTCIAKFPNPYDQQLEQELSKISQDRDGNEKEIIKSMIHAPVVKLQFEEAKRTLLLDNNAESISRFEALITSLNSDWRTTYRTFYILSNIDSENLDYWLPLAKRCNPEYPLEFIKPTAFQVSSLWNSN